MTIPPPAALLLIPTTRSETGPAAVLTRMLLADPDVRLVGERLADDRDAGVGCVPGRRCTSCPATRSGVYMGRSERP